MLCSHWSHRSDGMCAMCFVLDEFLQGFLQLFRDGFEGGNKGVQLHKSERGLAVGSCNIVSCCKAMCG